jgi:hypothetical protein
LVGQVTAAVKWRVLPLSLSGNICIFLQKYKAMVRSIKFKLADPKNPVFRRRICAGEIALATVPTLTSRQDQVLNQQRQ